MITTLLAHEPGLSLVGAALGAAIPSFVETLGCRRRLRLTMAVLVTMAALGVTYAGTFVVGGATDHEILPGTDYFSEGGPNPDPSGHSTPPSTPPADRSRIKVTPEVLTCKPGCDSPVTIKSTGTLPLVVGVIEIDGTAKASFTQAGQCAAKRLDQNEECTFDVQFGPSGATEEEKAELIIHHNVPEGPTVVALAGRGPQLEPDLTVDPDSVACAYRPTNSLNGGGSIGVSFHLSLTGSPEGLPDTVPVSVERSGGKAVTVTAPVGGDPHTVAATLAVPANADSEQTISIRVDPGGEIAESDENNNQIRFRVRLPDSRDTKQDLGC